VHLDIHTPDVDAEVERLERLGAARVDGPRSEHGARWIVVHDPEGNELCVCDAGQGPAEGAGG
jgi:predicted enzyme related to lactoylglutathione lyase